ncbi:hypothetical protein GCK72_012250 [Caenorhabditis remanei]|uniref:Uncharacterized protein n=1 Tax=Caenorhabditis remanei TaxID=31234 RepID=A0A6A5GKJ1_CAERE|nr:hypothetical protein GCK72_012250 [Caenorhabditis remanei]KAF1755800.1 hypothetical protein GCK72_012250 [Caenorhabditis remanei]
MSDLSQKFERDGFVVIENVFNDHEIEEMKGAIAKIVDDMNLAELPKSVFSTYDEDKVSTGHEECSEEDMEGAIAEIVDDMNLAEHPKSVFSTYDEDKEGAVDKNGELTVPKDKALNKIGHGLHFLDPTFKKMTFNTKIQKIFEEIGYQEPEVVQNSASAITQSISDEKTTEMKSPWNARIKKNFMASSAFYMETLLEYRTTLQLHYQHHRLQRFKEAVWRGEELHVRKGGEAHEDGK